MLKQLFKLAGLLLAAIMAQHYATVLALAERGYQAIGGEIFMFPAVLLIGGYALGLIERKTPVDFEDDPEDDYYDIEKESWNDFIEQLHKRAGE